MADGVKKINENIIKDGRNLTISTLIDPSKIQAGTIYVNPADGSVKFLKNNSGTKVWDLFNPEFMFNQKSITRKLIADSAIDEFKIDDLAVTTNKLKNLSVKTDKIDNLAVTPAKLAKSAVQEDKLADLAVSTIKIKDGAIVTSKLLDGAVTSDKILFETIVDTNIAPGTITGVRIAPLAISTPLLAQEAVTDIKLGKGSVITEKILDRAVTSIKLGLTAVENGNIADRAITGSKVALTALNTDHISSIHGRVLEKNSISNTPIADDAIQERNILKESVSRDKLNPVVKDLIDRSIKLEKTQTIAGASYSNYAWVKGSLMIRPEGTGNSKLEVVGDIAATGTVTATRCYNPVFADLAEAYIPTEKLKPGDAVALSLEGNLKVEKLTLENSDRFLGFVSDEYATIFGASPREIRDGIKVPVTLTGRIKINAGNREAKIGDFVYISNGEVKFSSKKDFRTCGRVLENKTEDNKYVLCQLWS